MAAKWTNDLTAEESELLSYVLYKWRDELACRCWMLGHGYSVLQVQHKLQAIRHKLDLQRDRAEMLDQRSGRQLLRQG